MNEHHQVTDVWLEGENLCLTIDGERRTFSLAKVSSRLATASEEERNIVAGDCSQPSRKQRLA